MKTAIYNGKLITPAEVLENKVLVLENDRIIDILAEDVIDLGQYDEKIDAHGRYVCPGFIDPAPGRGRSGGRMRPPPRT